MASIRLINKTYTTPKLVRIIKHIGETRVCFTFIHPSSNSSCGAVFSRVDQGFASIDTRRNLNCIILNKTNNSTNKGTVTTSINIDRTDNVLDCTAVSVTDNTSDPLTSTTHINGPRGHNTINNSALFTLITNKSPNGNFTTITKTLCLIICRIDINIFKS